MYDVDEMTQYIRQAARARGIDPVEAIRAARSEGLSRGTWQSNVRKNGVREPSFGPFQLLVGGPGTGFPAGMGNDFMRATGLDPSKVENRFAAVDFALDQAAKNGWQAWYGPKNIGMSRWQGIGSGASPQGVNTRGLSLAQAKAQNPAAIPADKPPQIPAGVNLGFPLRSPVGDDSQIMANQPMGSGMGFPLRSPVGDAPSPKVMVADNSLPPLGPPIEVREVPVRGVTLSRGGTTPPTAPSPAPMNPMALMKPNVGAGNGVNSGLNLMASAMGKDPQAEAHAVPIPSSLPAAEAADAGRMQAAQQLMSTIMQSRPRRRLGGTNLMR